MKHKLNELNETKPGFVLVSEIVTVYLGVARNSWLRVNRRHDTNLHFNFRRSSSYVYRV